MVPLTDSGSLWWDQAKNIDTSRKILITGKRGVRPQSRAVASSKKREQTFLACLSATVKTEM